MSSQVLKVSRVGLSSSCQVYLSTSKQGGLLGSLFPTMIKICGNRCVGIIGLRCQNFIYV